MQRARGKLPIYLIAVLVFSSCLVHFFQLLRFTDNSTGYINGSTIMPVIVYVLVFAAVGLAGLYSNRCENLMPIDLSDGNRKMYFICCFYFAVFSITAKGSNYDFRNFTFLHLVPVLWSFTRLILIMIKIVDVKQDSDTVLEFLLLSFMLMFFFSYVLILDNSGRASKLFVFSALSTFVLASVIALPRIVIIITGKGEVLYPVDYTSISYFAAGLFAVLQIKHEK